MRGAACSTIDTRLCAKTFGGLEGGGGGVVGWGVWEGAAGEYRGGEFRGVWGGGQVPPNSWVCGPHSLTHALPLPKWIGCHQLGYFWQWVPKTSGGREAFMG